MRDEQGCGTELEEWAGAVVGERQLGEGLQKGDEVSGVGGEGECEGGRPRTSPSFYSF